MFATPRLHYRWNSATGCTRCFQGNASASASACLTVHADCLVYERTSVCFLFFSELCQPVNFSDLRHGLFWACGEYFTKSVICRQLHFPMNFIFLLNGKNAVASRTGNRQVKIVQPVGVRH